MSMAVTGTVALQHLFISLCGPKGRMRLHSHWLFNESDICQLKWEGVKRLGLLNKRLMSFMVASSPFFDPHRQISVLGVCLGQASQEKFSIEIQHSARSPCARYAHLPSGYEPGSLVGMGQNPSMIPWSIFRKPSTRLP